MPSYQSKFYELNYKRNEAKAKAEYHKAMANLAYRTALIFSTDTRDYHKYINRHAHHAQSQKKYENAMALLEKEIKGMNP